MPSKKRTSTIPHPSQGKKLVWLSAFLFLLMLPVLSPLWLRWIGLFLVVTDPLEEADALAILAGDEIERTAEGSRIFLQGVADWFILTDMRLDLPESQGQYSASVERRLLSLGVPAEKIMIAAGPVATTYEEAQRLLAFARAHGFRSLIVVTSPYHTRRARWILTDVFRDSGITLAVRPVLDHPYQASNWWQSARDRQLTVLEYAKMLAYLLGCREHTDCRLLEWALLESWPALDVAAKR